LLAVEEWIAAEGMEAVRQTLRNPGSLAGLMQRLNERLKQ
jgi:PHD/YefM family antitoxin component YafN of YafNO toxin-antitoxin module